MGESSKIQWTEATWNPWHGCLKVSKGCKFCYMYRDKERYGQDPTTVLKSKTNFKAPLKWKEPKIIFTCSWSDWFIEQADEWRNEAWEIIKNTPQHTYQILTKRPERIKQCLPNDWGSGYKNVWLGVSIEDQEAVKRADIISDVPTWIGNRFLSIEPLLEKLEIPKLTLEHFSWVIIGGESGNENGAYRYRECKIEWIDKLIFQCQKSNIPVFVKQLGTHLAKELKLKDSHGGNINEWPERLRIREMPK